MQTGLSRAAFARRSGVAIRTIRNWEQGRRTPQGPARVLLVLLGWPLGTGTQGLSNNLRNLSAGGSAPYDALDRLSSDHLGPFLPEWPFLS